LGDKRKKRKWAKKEKRVVEAGHSRVIPLAGRVIGGTGKAERRGVGNRGEKKKKGYP